MVDKQVNKMDSFEASKIVTDEYSAKILIATYTKSMNAIELSRILDIPIAACYRRIHTLEKAGLLKLTERALTRQGKRISMYQSNLKNAYIFLENGKLRVRFELVSGQMVDHGEGWSTVDLRV